MATTSTKIQLDWKEIGKHVDLREIVRTLPPDDVVQILGQSKVIEALGPEKVLDELLASIPAEQLEEMLRRRRQQGQSPAGE